MNRTQRPRLLYSFPHPLGAPGIGTTAWQQVQGAIDLEFPTTVYTTSIARPLHGRVDIVETLRFRGRRVPHRVVGVTRAWRYHDRLVARHLERASGSVDVVHCWPAACESTLHAARRLGIPALREAPSAHTVETMKRANAAAAEVRIELPDGQPFRFSPRELGRELREFELADRLLVPSSFCEETFLERGTLPDKLVRHRYGFDPAEFFPEARLGKGDRPTTFLFVGRIEPTKGVHHALDAWQRSGVGNHGARFVIVGAALPAYRRYLDRALADPSVVELGFRSDVAQLMRKSDVLVVPSAVEGSALVTYEGVGSGCALLVSDSAGIAWSDGAACLEHAYGDVASLADHMREIRAHSGLLQRLRAEARALGPTLTWDAAGARLGEIYRETSYAAPSRSRPAGASRP